VNPAVSDEISRFHAVTSHRYYTMSIIKQNALRTTRPPFGGKNTQYFN